MADRFTYCGKQVLLDGAHYADAVDEIAAKLICRALISRLADGYAQLRREPDPLPIDSRIVGVSPAGFLVTRFAYTGARQADEELIWRCEDVGNVTPAGNIVGAEPGCLWASGSIYVTTEQAAIAEGFGWRIESRPNEAGLVRVIR